MERKKGRISGVYYLGYAATFMRNQQPSHCIVAGDMDTLREIWGELTDQPLNEEMVAEVGIFRAEQIEAD